MNETYVLKEAVDENVLENLNDKRYEGLSVSGSMANKLFRAMNGKCKTEYVGIDQIEDWIAALKSGKKIANPLSPKEALNMNYQAALEEAKIYEPEEGYDKHAGGYIEGIRTAVKFISEEYPDVKDWIQDK